jgi:iron complex outermembrane receptor protein
MTQSMGVSFVQIGSLEQPSSIGDVVMKKVKSYGVYALVGAFGVGNAYAQTAPEAPAAAPAAKAAPAKDMSEVVVTGSRTAPTGNDQPTPVTVVTTAELAANTPSNIADALNKLPLFTGGTSTGNLASAISNTQGNVLNLRGFGAIRTLILQDGRRVPATSASGTVDTNTLPQLLVKRIDVVTGGASAVYGSDAVTGVVNYVLDNRFDGVKGVVQGGTSSRSDNGSNKVGIAAGKFFDDGRLHVEGSLELFNSEGIPDRSARGLDKPVCVQGAGTAAVPYRFYANCRNSNSAEGGLIRTGPLAGQQFATNGVLTPFVHGASTGTAGVESGGDGTYAHPAALIGKLKTQQAFGRIDYEFTPDVRGYVQASYAENTNSIVSATLVLNPNVISATNPYLTAAQQAAASGPGAVLVGGLPTFTLGRLFTDEMYKHADIIAKTTTPTVTVGLKGRLANELNWDVYYTHARSTQATDFTLNNNNGRQYAALDAVRVTSANVGTTGLAIGSIVCNVSLTHPGLYPGCLPINPFGPTASDPAAIDYVRGLTQYSLVNTMNDVGASLAGVAFENWAGPVRMAVNGEVRKVGLSNVSNAQPTTPLSCVGLRFNCTANSVLWGGNTTADMSASETISEAAVEATVPLLANMPLAKSLDLNLATRYARYSVSGKATTFKVGFEWHVSDDLTFRGTRSRDIRAPTLFDLFQPLSQNQSPLADVHTGVTQTVPTITQGNANLTPEVAYTRTIGVVFQPRSLPRFSVALDYYNLDLSDAISLVSGLTPATQGICEASGGTSPLCDLYVRPLPFSNRTAANVPTRVYARPQNIALTQAAGIDVEVNYGLIMRDLSTALDGRLNLRALANHQPTYKSRLFPGQALVNSAGIAGVPPGAAAIALPRDKVTLQANYALGALSVGTQARWRSGMERNADPTIVFIADRIPSFTVADLNASYKLKLGGKNLELFVSVQNVFDKLAQPFSSLAGQGTVVPGDDIIGRYFTAGVRGSF